MTLMETPRPINFVVERLRGGAWAALADMVMSQTVEPVIPPNIVLGEE